MHSICCLLLYMFSQQAQISIQGKNENVQARINSIKTDTNRYQRGNFSKPLDLPVVLNAGFGDLRSNHFHSGIDLFTNHKTGYKVHAVASGYVSRIKIQSGGYGNALYITHDNGYTSVYGHLEKYNAVISAYIHKAQYAASSFELDIYPAVNELSVLKDEEVASSGDSGFSGGPHLHFEVRNTETEEIINPLLIGPRIADHIKPHISGIYVFHLRTALGVTRFEPGAFIKAIKTASGVYRLNSIIHEAGKIVFGIIAGDASDAGKAHNIYSVRLTKNGKEIFSSKLDHFGFDQTRAVNSYFYYPLLVKSNFKVQLSYIEPGNPLKIYRPDENGIIEIKADDAPVFNYLVADVNGNTSKLEFRIACTKQNSDEQVKNEIRFASDLKQEVSNIRGFPSPIIHYDKDTLVFFGHSQIPGKLKDAETTLLFKAGALFSNIILNYSSLLRGDYTEYLIGKSDIPMKDSVLLGIKLPGSKSVQSGKWILITTGNKPEPAFEKNGILYTWIHNFGVFHLEQDLAPPVIEQVFEKKIKGISGKRIAFRLSDNLSGIGTYRAEIDGKWELFEYDAKNHLLYSNFTGRSNYKKHKLTLRVSDRVGNTSNLTIEI